MPSINTIFLDNLHALLKVYNLLVSEKESCLKVQFCWDPCNLTHLVGCALERKSHRKIQYSWPYSYLEYFYLGIQVDSRAMNDIFGLPQDFVTCDLYTETILVPQRCCTFKNCDSVLRSLLPSLIRAIYVLVKEHLIMLASFSHAFSCSC